MSQTYPSSYYKTIETVERSHFWFNCRSIMLTDLVHRFFPHSTGASFFEIGCGTGVAIRLLESLGFTVTGLDVNAKALYYAKRYTKAKLIKQSIFSYSTRDKYEAVGAFDVLEHQTRDLAFLRRAFMLLKPGGIFFLTVPSGRRLWNEIDVRSGHKRRYEPTELIEKVEEAGFTVRFWNYWNVLSLPFFILERIVLSRRVRHNMVGEYLKMPSPLVNKFMELLLRFEQKLMFRVRYPLGASLVLCARKPI